MSRKTRRARRRALGTVIKRHLPSIEAMESRLLLSATLYVDTSSPGPTHDGTSWGSAYADLQLALAAATPGTEIHVADGTFRPTSTTDRTISFQLKSGVSLLGGYPGYGAVNPDARDAAANPTILSGNIGSAGSNTDNSYHVVVGSGTDSTAILDGFTITAGAANGNTNDLGNGGGMYSSVGSPSVTNCTFSGNIGAYGAGMYNNWSNSTVSNCVFSSNTGSASAGGGGMYNYSSSPTLTNCTFISNTAQHGGGMYNEGSSPTLTDCTFSGNTATDYAGGMYNSDSSPTLNNCNFTANSSANAGGIFNGSDCITTLVNCRFSGNKATYSGGGIYNTYASTTLTNCSFSGNTASGGGGMYSSSSSVTLTSCTFSADTAGLGGGMYNYSCSLALTNCIIWSCGNSPITAGASTPTITYSDIQGGYAGIGNLDIDPRFVRSPWAGPDGVFGTTDDQGDLRLRVGSPALNAGSNSAIPAGITTDLAGNPRIQIGIVDMGAYEGAFAAPAPRLIYVDRNAPGANNGTSWTHAFTSLSSAILAASDGDTIRIADGTYKPTTDTDRTASFGLRSGVSLYGGYAGYGAADPDARDIVAWPAVLSGDIGATGDITDNSYHVVTAVGITNATVDGVTITLGFANGNGADQQNGAGFLNQISSLLTLSNCIFSANTASASGGGLYNDYSSPTLTNCTFSANTASANSGGGGGMYNTDSSPTLTNSTFSGNTATYGGGIYNDDYSSSPTLNNCTFSGNTATYGGGGIYNNNYAWPNLTDCTFNGNAATDGGGIYNAYYNNPSPTLTNCTFIANTASSSGGGMYNHLAWPILTNCTFDANTAGSGGGMYNDHTTPVLTNCTFIGNMAVSGNGGGIYNYISTTTLTNCSFIKNTASSNGGGMYISYSSPTLTNCSFSGNTATYGGGISTDSSSPAMLLNCTFSGNSASYGGGMYDYSGGPILTNCTFSANTASVDGRAMYNIFAGPWLTNCIVWGSGSSPIFGGADIRYTDIQGGNAGVGNLNSDPLFVDADGADNVYGTADDDLRLRAGSPCLDAGSPDVYLASDLEGNARFVDIPGAHDPGAIMDMGAYERQLPLVAGSGNLVLDGPAPSIKLNFNNVLLASTLAVDNVTVRTVLPDGSLGGTIAVTSVTYDPSSKSATFAIPVATPDGNYRATLLAGSISDTYGSSPAADFSFDFFILAADANHDRKVDVSDLHVLANNWGGSGKTFSQGDFNNDGTVGNADLAILAARWQFTLAAPTASLPASLAAPVRRTATRVVSLLS